MKKLFALAVAAFAQAALANIANGPHDLSQRTGATLSSCQYCHAPHKANTGVAGAPLWNRINPTAPPTGTTAVDYTEYASNTFIGTPVLGANSLTCFSCHDGVSDMGQTFSGTHGFNGTKTTIGNVAANLGTDLTDDHPVGVVYNRSGTAAYVASPTGVKLYTSTGGLSVQCASCHDPHGFSDPAAVGNNDGIDKFLRVPATQICSSCHLK